MGIRKCIVPTCTNTSETSPNKTFIIVPKEEQARTKWFQTIGKKVSKTPFCHCCEDHFDLPQDALNYIRQKYLGGPIKLKPGVVPHKKLTAMLCRLCLKRQSNEDKPFRIDDNNEQLKNMLQICLPEIDFLITVDPVLCNKCHHQIETFHKLKVEALAREVKIVSCMKRQMEELSENDKLKEDYRLDLFKSYNSILNDSIQPIVLRKRRREDNANSGNKHSISTAKPEMDEPREKILKDGKGTKQLEDENWNPNMMISGNANVHLETENPAKSQVKAHLQTETQTEQHHTDLDNAPVILDSSVVNVTDAGCVETISDLNNCRKLMYNNEVCQVVYLNEDGTGSYTTVNVIQLLETNNENASSCLFCAGYVGDDILNHSFTHCGGAIRCSLCEFSVDNASEEDISGHIYVHSIVGSETEGGK